MIPYLYTAEAEPDALLDVNSIPLQDVNSVELLASGDPTAARAFDTNGLGALTNTLSCEVSEERNGEYELTMEYPMNGVHFDELALRKIIFAKPNATDGPQAFRIYFISAEINGVVTINARHITYDLSGIPVVPFTATSAGAACSGLMSNAQVSNPFSIGTQIGTIADFKVDVPSSVRSWFGGKEGSLIDVYGGEWHYDNYTATLKASRGQNRGVVIRYGKNLIDFEQEKNCEEVWTGVLPYWADEEGTVVRANIINIEGSFDYRRILCLDLSQDFEEQPTTAQLTARAQTYIRANNIGVPKVSITLDWAQLNEQVELCDTVTVVFERLGVETTAKCVRTVWDVLKDRYSSIEIGDARTNITDTIHKLRQEEEKQKSTVSASMMRAIMTATALITGNAGGYVVMRDSDNDGYPDEILIMDTPDVETATKVWRWNQSGLGYSSSGVEGLFGLAMTSQGQIVADFITTGTMSANRILGGTLKLGGSGNGNGVAQIYDANGNLAVTLNREGVVINRTATYYASNYSQSDLTTMQQIITGSVVPTMAQFDKYDLNGDGRISAIDLNIVSRMVNGYDSSHSVPVAVEIGNTDSASVLETSGVTIRDSGMYATNIACNSIVIYGLYTKTASAAANVYVDSSGNMYRSTSSSRRYKEGITEDLADLDPEKLYDLPVVRFRFMDGYISEDDERHGKDVIGFIAEDVDELYPIAVRHEDGQPEMWESNYLIPAMMKLIQNQKKEIDELRERLDRLEARF